MSRPLAAVLALLALAVTPLAAQTPDTVRFRVSGDLGFVSASGNTDSRTFNVGERLRWRPGKLTLSQGFGLISGRTNGEETANLWRVDLRGDYAVGDHVGVYALVAWDRNPFAGFRGRFEEGVGAFWKAIQAPKDKLTIELGLGFIQQDNVATPDLDFPTARVAANYRHDLYEKAFLYDLLEVLPNLENSSDLRVNNEAGIAAPINRSIAIKLSYLIRFDNEPEAGFETTDRFFTAGVQATF